MGQSYESKARRHDRRLAAASLRAPNARNSGGYLVLFDMLD